MLHAEHGRIYVDDVITLRFPDAELKAFVDIMAKTMSPNGVPALEM